MYEKPRVNVKVEPRSTFTFTRGFSYITSILIYARKTRSSLRPYARKNYATVEIHLNEVKHPGSALVFPVEILSRPPNNQKKYFLENIVHIVWMLCLITGAK